MRIANVWDDIFVVVGLSNKSMGVEEKQSANYRPDCQSSFDDHQHHWRFLPDYHSMYVDLIEVMSIIDNDLQVLLYRPTMKQDIVGDFF